MKFAGKAFVGGLFGTLGIGAAILGTAAVAGFVFERKVKSLIAEFEKMTETRES